MRSIQPARELDLILADMEGSGAVPRRAAKRIRRAVDLMLADQNKPDQLAIWTRPDVPQVTSCLASQLVIHHLGLAAAYYECSGPDLEGELAAAHLDELSLAAERAWLRELNRSYNALDQEDQDEPS